MIVLILFEAGRPQPAETCNVHLDVTGWVGKGDAVFKFIPTKDLTNTVLCVPTLMCHESGACTRLSLTHVSLKWHKHSSLVKEDELVITKASWDGERAQGDDNLSYFKVKASTEPSIISLSGAQSQDDYFFRIGTLEAGVELAVSIGFVFTFKPSIALDCSSVNCIFAAMAPCNDVSINLNMISTVPIDKVECISSDNQTTDCSSTCTSADLSTRINDSSMTCVFRSTNTNGFVVKLRSPNSTSSLTSFELKCFSLLLETPLTVNSNGTEHNYQGVQMLSSIPLRQHPLSDWHELSSCEMLFLVDCSGSMSGKKMYSTSEALVLAIKSLPPTCTFNIVAFGSKYRFLFQNSMVASTKYVERALQFSNQLKACLGGTELLTPLRWLLKKPLCEGDLPRQLILITDGGVPNVSNVLHTVRRYQHKTRCHTIALGPDISSELMATLAYETGGRYVIINEETRLQTKVMEVVNHCLHPPITDATVSWPSPTGFAMDPLFPSPPDTFPMGTSQTFFTALERPSCLKKGSNVTFIPPVVTGFVSNERVQGVAVLDHENAPPISDSRVTLLKNAAWFKMKSLNETLLTSSKKKKDNHEKDCHEPPTKKPRLSEQTQQSSREDLINEMVSISIASGVSYYPYTHFKSTNEGEGQGACQLLPWSGKSKAKSRSKTTNASSSHRVRKRQRKSSKPVRHRSNHPSVPSLSLFAKSTATSITSALKTAVNLATFGLINMERGDQLLEEGERIEDQDYYDNKDDRIHWDGHNRLVLPKFYYKSYTESDTLSNNPSTSINTINGTAPRIHVHVNGESHSDESNNEDQFIPPTDIEMVDNEMDDIVAMNGYNGSDINTLVCDDMKPDYTALIQLQLPHGGWHLTPALSSAICVPVATVLTLPTIEKTGLTTSEYNHDVTCTISQTRDLWISILVLACLEANFDHLRIEWSLLALKTQTWIKENEHCIPISIADATSIAIKLVRKVT